MKFLIVLGLISVAYGADLAPFVKKLTPEEVHNISTWRPGDKGQPWQMSGQTEGDMVLIPKQRNGILSRYYRWPGDTLVYLFDSKIVEVEKQIIRAAFDEISKNTCIIFKEWVGQRDYVHITVEDNGCFSNVGRIGGRQQLNLQRTSCMNEAGIVHEVLHALGFYHQHSVPERDEYVKVNWENIIGGKNVNFNINDEGWVTSFGWPYDYRSIMHYDEFAYSKNGERTMEALDGSVIGSTKLSEIDINKINDMYMCP